MNPSSVREAGSTSRRVSPEERRPALEPGERWYLVNTQSGREELARQHLERQAYRTFVPWTWRSIRHARQIRTIRSAFFPGYLFVPLDLTRDRWRPIDGTIGVLRLVKAGSAPLAAPQGLVEALIDATGKDGALDRVGADLRAGQSVRVIRGPFADQLALVESLDGAGRVRVLLSIMNQSVPVSLMRQDLARADA